MKEGQLEEQEKVQQEIKSLKERVKEYEKARAQLMTDLQKLKNETSPETDASLSSGSELREQR